MRWVLSVLLGVWGCATPRASIVTGGQLLGSGRTVWMVGVARNAKLGAIAEVDQQKVYCGDWPAWPADLEGRPVVLEGGFAKRSFAPPPVGPRGDRYAAPEGEAGALVPCRLPAAVDDQGLLGAERALMAAFARRDAATLEALVDPGLVLRAPGQKDLDRAGFLKASAAVPGEILAVDGEGLVAHRSGDAGIVRGVQVARVRVDGKEVVDRGAFVDVFERRGDRWVLTFALTAPIEAR